jgi:hypothetical protein
LRDAGAAPQPVAVFIVRAKTVPNVTAVPVAAETAIPVIVAVKACAAIAVATIASIAIPAPLASVAPFAAASAAVLPNEGDRLIGLECRDSARRRGAGGRDAKRQQRGNRRDLYDLSDHWEIPSSGLHLGLNNAVRSVPVAAGRHTKCSPHLTQ